MSNPNKKHWLDSLLGRLVAGFTIIAIILAGAWGADQKWEDETLLAQYSKQDHTHDYATRGDVGAIKHQIDIQSRQQRIYLYQDDLADIQDRRDAGAASNLDLRKERRINTQIDNLKDEIRNLPNVQ